MAIKAALAAALLLALVALASATTFTVTTVTTTTTDEENSQQCSQQVQGRRFSKCEFFLKQRGSPYTNEEEGDEAFAIANPQQGSLQACCQELRQMDHQHCGCEAIRHAARQAQQSASTGYGITQSQQIYQRARTLPRRCHLRQQQCRFTLVFV